MHVYEPVSKGWYHKLAYKLFGTSLINQELFLSNIVGLFLVMLSTRFKFVVGSQAVKIQTSRKKLAML